jgi:hypothetical protein
LTDGKQYADIMHMPETDPLRELLGREIGQVDRRATAQERFERIMTRLGPTPAQPVEEIPKEYYDWLAGDPEPSDLSENLRRELGVKA